MTNLVTVQIRGHVYAWILRVIKKELCVEWKGFIIMGCWFKLFELIGFF